MIPWILHCNIATLRGVSTGKKSKTDFNSYWKHSLSTFMAVIDQMITKSFRGKKPTILPFFFFFNCSKKTIFYFKFQLCPVFFSQVLYPLSGAWTIPLTTGGRVYYVTK